MQTFLDRIEFIFLAWGLQQGWKQMQQYHLDTLASLNLCEGDFRACFRLPALIFSDEESSIESDITFIRKSYISWTTTTPIGKKLLDKAKNSRIFFLEKTKKNLTDGIAIGRDSSNDIIVNIPTVSKSHCVLVRYHGTPWYLIDCKSSNGTLVDGQRVIPNKPTVLADNCKITLANEVSAKFHTPIGLWKLLEAYSALKYAD